MLTIFLVKLWAADVCDDRTLTLKDIYVLILEALHIGVLQHGGHKLRLCGFLHVSKLPPVHSGFCNTLCTTCCSG